MAAVRQLTRATLKGRRRQDVTTHNVAYRVPSHYTGVLDYTWHVQTHRRITMARQVIRSALLLQRIKRRCLEPVLPLLDCCHHAMM